MRIIPLGGLDGIGKNMTAFECGDDIILVDAGLMFPEDDQPGIDLILPDYTYILENEDRLRGIVITHGHEDHIGALPYLLRDLSKTVPLFASDLTLGIIEAKLTEFNLKRQEYRPMVGGSHIKLGCLTVDFIPMTHSIPAAFTLLIGSPQGCVMHTGDFKLDQTPIDGVTPDYNAINRFAEAGIDLFLADSTNANRPGFTPSESAVGPALRHIIKNAQGRVFVSCFSSHIHRLQQICDASIQVGRKILVTGRSMLTNTRVARELGYLKVPSNSILDSYEAKDLPDEKVVIMCTGSQGEPLSALSRMANGEHKTLSIKESDTVIFSATPVPGNEKSVQTVINQLSKLGCDVYDCRRALVHVSGHSSQEELKLMQAMVHPRYFMPVHGEAQHLRAHAELACKMGMKKDHVFVIDNGDSLEMVNHEVRRAAPVESGLIYVDGLRVGSTEPTVLRDRKRLAEDGMVSCVVTRSLRSQEVDDIEILSRGVSFVADGEVLSQAKSAVLEVFNHYKHRDSSPSALRRAIRNSLSNFLWDKTHTRPMIIPVVMEI